MAAHPGVSAAAQGATNRWSARRGPALLVRTVAYLAPIVASILFVHAAGQVVPAPLSSLWLYLAWWFGLSVAATVVLIAIDRVTRRLLPLAALLHLSLVFPDEAPSRFKVAFRAGDVDRLESRLAAKHAAASLLSVDAAHGVLANDGDVNSTTLTATPQTSTSGIFGGTFTLNADGSFTYQTGALAGQDVFTYTITDGNGQTATGTVTFDVALLPPSGGTFYLQSTGLSPEVWDLSTVVPTVVSPVPDLDADGHPGLTIAGGDGKVTITDPKKQQAWTYETGASTLGLHGPMTLNLTAASSNFDTGKAETLWLYVYDCPGGASTLSTTGCTALAQNTVLVPKWNLTAAYATHSVVVSMNADLAAGRQLRIRLLVGGASMWIPLVGPYQSTLDYTN